MKFFDLTKEDETDELTCYSGKWTNVAFDKNGNSYRGKTLHETECDAANYIDGIISSGEYKGLLTLDGRLPITDYSHAIQIPTI